MYLLSGKPFLLASVLSQFVLFLERKVVKSSLLTRGECSINLGCDVDFDFAGPAIHGSAAFGCEGWLAGYQMTFDSAKSKLTRNNFAVGYRTGGLPATH